MRPVRHLGLLTALGLSLLAAPDRPDPWQAQRNRMVEKQLELREVSHPATLAAMRKVPRHLFVPVEFRREAYADHPLPIGHDQTISQPYIVACMTELIAPTKETRVLEIGTGSGYQAAVLAEICAEVFTIEIIPELARQAAAVLRQLGYKNVRTRTGDGWKGWPEAAPFDAIIVTAAPETIPPPLLDQLKEGGRMILPVGPQASGQNLVLVTKEGGKIRTRPLDPVRFVPFVRERK
ncbi:MAG: protein-L-isoaspartate(D-aspartate) O-methyltransferase [Opitutae bacterium]|nr:protein-L-isoaspartate(D-aspartate) O-methyltransferase [Opitutae bacterium]